MDADWRLNIAHNKALQSPDAMAEQLLEAAVAWLTERGVPRVMLWAAAPNLGAQRLFEWHGFRKTMIEMTKDV